MIFLILVQRWFGGCLCLLLLCITAASAQPHIISEINILSTDDGVERTEKLPYFVRQEHSGVTQKIWTFNITKNASDSNLPALLFPQPIQGAKISLGSQVIYEFPGSDEQNLRNWYRPILINIPPNLLKADQPNTVTVHQKSHLRGWFISPILIGELQTLRPLYEHYTFISQTLSTTINFFSALAGSFLLIIGIYTNSRAYKFGGMGVLIWSMLFTVALISQIPAEFWFLWRLLLYAATGLLIYFVSMFIAEIFHYQLSKKLRIFFFVYLNFGWIFFAFKGQQVETLLDVVWTALAIGIYIVISALAILKALQNPKQIRMILAIAVHWLITSVLAVHDYTLQAGWLPLVTPIEPKQLWSSIVLQPIYLTHLALPAFVILAMWLLMQDHIQKNRNEIEHAKLLHAQREQIVSDIHDGVGSRINLLLWGLRSHSPSYSHIESELQYCIEELRFAINPTNTGYETLHRSLSDLCERLQIQCRECGIKLQFSYQGQVATINSDIALHLYKAVQECLSNALRHSRADRIKLEWMQSDKVLSLCIQDNGRGIPYWNNDKQKQDIAQPTSLGLQGLRYRIFGKSGRIYIHSDSKGTIIRIEIPLNFPHET